MMRRLILALLAAVALPAAADADSVLRVVPLNELKVLDPIWSTGYSSRDHGYLIYDTLFATDDRGVPRPQMIERWTVSEDKLTWSFTLRPGLKWHDGQPVTAADCVASIRRWAARDFLGQQLMASTADLEAKDADRLVLTLKRPFGLVLEALGRRSSIPAFMMPRRIGESDPAKPITETVGSGPFIFKRDEWVPGHKLVYVKNPEYRPRSEPPEQASGGKVVKVDRMEWIVMPDANTAVAALMKGEVDYYQAPPQDYLKRMAADPHIRIEQNDPQGTLNVLRMNHLTPPFNNKLARQAVLRVAAAAQVDYMEAAVGDKQYYRECLSVYCGGALESAVGTEGLAKADMAAAKKLLSESGYKGEKVVLLQVTDSPQMSNQALVTADLLKKLGVNVEIQAMDFQTMVTRRTRKEPADQGGWNLFHTNGAAGDFADPFSLFLSASGPERGWIGWVDVPEIESLKQAYALEVDVAKRKPMAERIQQLALDNVAYVPLGINFTPIAYRDNVKGILHSPVFFYWNIEVAR